MEIYKIKKGTPGCHKSVMELQELLNKRLNPSPNLTADGIFGRKTFDAVYRFQWTQGLERTGTVDHATWFALMLPLPTPGTVESKTTAPAGKVGTSGLDIEKAVQALNANAQTGFTGECSYYVAVAINAGLPAGAKPLTVLVVTKSEGKVSRLGPTDGGWMGDVLEPLKFVKVPSQGYQPQTGDVAVTPPFYGDTRGKNSRGYGHVAMWNGQEWVSDAKQGSRPEGYGAVYTEKDVKRGTLPKDRKVGQSREYPKPVEYWRP